MSEESSMAEAPFTMKQIVAVAGLFSAISGIGGGTTGAFAVMANDKVQDSTIKANTDRISVMEQEIKKAREASVRTEEQVNAVKEIIDEVKGDVKYIQKSLNQLLGELRSRDP